MSYQAYGSPLRLLSLGTQDDSSLLWLVDTVLVEPEDRLICLSNTASSGASEQSQQHRIQQNRAET